MKIAISFIILSVLFIHCFNYPTELNGQKTADCSNPTKPKSFQLDTNNYSVVLEIYDYKQELIEYSESQEKYSFSGNTHSNAPVDIYWNGAKKNGEQADPGKYVAKLSWFYKNVKSCQCSEIIKEE